MKEGGVIMVGVTGLGCKGVTRRRAGLRTVGVDGEGRKGCEESGALR